MLFHIGLGNQLKFFRCYGSGRCRMTKEKVEEVGGGRQTLYYVGNGLTALGVILFFSVFFSVFGRVNSDSPFSNSHVTVSHNFMGQPTIKQSNPASAFIRAPIGILLIFIGQFMAKTGKLGLAGSGVILNPKQARRDLEPYSRQTGGMLSDAVEEVVPVLSQAMREVSQSQEPAKEVVKIRCRECSALNDEHDKFCGQCGAKL